MGTLDPAPEPWTIPELSGIDAKQVVLLLGVDGSLRFRLERRDANSPAESSSASSNHKSPSTRRCVPERVPLRDAPSGQTQLNSNAARDPRIRQDCKNPLPSSNVSSS